MVKNYFMVAIRNLLRYKVYSLINVLGLAVGMACCVLILLFVQHELRYDTFHEQSDRIYRVVRETRGVSGAGSFHPGTSGLLAGALVQDLPEVEKATRVMINGNIWVRYGDDGFSQTFCVADPEMLEMFDFPLIKGNVETALQNRFSVLVTEETAQKYFGEEDPVGKVITAEGRYHGGDYTITGVLKNVPEYSSLQFDFLSATVHQEIPLTAWEQWQPNTSWRPVRTYVLLRASATGDGVPSKLSDLMTKYMGEEVSRLNTYALQPLTRMHLYSEVDYGFPGGGDITRVIIFASIAFFILMIACINFMNLSTARSVNRAREVGLRKVVGASKGQLVRQFLGEAVLLSCLALVLTLGLVELALPYLNDVTGYALTLGVAESGVLWMGLLGIGVFVGLLAGCYPAFFLSSFLPVQVLKGQVKTGKKGVGLRKGLVVFQFAISVVLIVGTVVVQNQMVFVENKKLGFEKEQVVVLPLFNTDRSLNARYQTVKQAFLEHPNVLKASASNSTMAWWGGAFQTVYPEGAVGNEWQMRILGVDEDFLNTYEIELVAGRNFSSEITTDATEAYILNETAVKQLGWDDPIGKSFEWAYWKRKGIVVGVVKDFHNRSLKEPILPFAMCMWQDKYNLLSLKIRSDNMLETMAFLEKTWQQFIPDRPFAATFMDEYLSRIYQSEKVFKDIFQIFAALAIFVACLGLLGLMSFTVTQRTREIGVRKVLGASVGGIIALLTGEFVRLILLANLIAWPVAYYVMDQWLATFAYRIDLGVGVFLLGGVLTWGIAFLAICIQTWRAARANPVDALRYE